MSAYRTSALALAGALALSGPAFALDRTPADPVRSCPSSGPGFLEVPGTSTCIRVSGRIVTDVTGGTRRVSREDVVGLGASGSVALDARTNTEYGPVRGYVRMRAGQGTRD